MSPRPLILIGPSGAGKTTLAQRLSKLLALPIFVTTTTRPPRSKNDTSHEFVDVATFEQLEQSKKLVGLVNAFGFRYGLRQFPKDKNVIMEFRAAVIPQFKQGYPNSFIVAVEAPLEVLRERIKQRGEVNRLNTAQLSQEITLGRTVADMTISSTQSVEQAAERIAQAYQAYQSYQESSKQ